MLTNIKKTLILILSLSPNRRLILLRFLI
ncbi:hypothetical protein EG341_06600 [Chryseobacterium lactis]|uniref:Uncharacterized protein n=1 Tax=Chryseobacterium lactis TaxID=1241981 RepID=A0ABM7AZZ5_CHRLC|nr:hypothetical protein EG342_15730 [Chryseobacterium lactis]AZB03620.1 hypothetical protein EG341_06600 [Chryseobacterium lactis]